MENKPIQFRVEANKAVEIKVYAAQRQMSITDLFLDAYEEYRLKHAGFGFTGLNSKARQALENAKTGSTFHEKVKS